MTSLTVKNFSCIHDADLKLAKITVLIGPQASGKSVLCKLVYFFVDLLDFQMASIEDQQSIEAFGEKVKARFIEWFPVSAWGGKKFSIEFKAGAYTVKISRNAYNNEINNNLRLHFSAFFKQQYSGLLDSMQKKSGASARARLTADFERRYQLRRVAAKFLNESLGDEYYSEQLFIPAARTFFTSLGRAILAFEHGQFLDPITVQFGRTFGSLHGHEAALLSEMSGRSKIFEKMSELIGGKLHYEGDRAYILSDDGRKVPYSALSSGQQEILPLMLVLGVTGAFKQREERQLIYIEEPEAHLFPKAQSDLINILATFAMEKQKERNLILTTHSPYVLTKLNTLIKAGSLGKSFSPKRQQILAQLIPRTSWLPPGTMSAYALDGGRVRNIIDRQGFVDGDYLDSVSTEISNDFSALLDLEHNGES